MRTLLMTGALLAWLAVSAGADDTRPKTDGAESAKQAACHGTAVEFVESPVEAAKLAAKQKKLVLVLHVSGHFEDPGFT